MLRTSLQPCTQRKYDEKEEYLKDDDKDVDKEGFDEDKEGFDEDKGGGGEGGGEGEGEGLFVSLDSSSISMDSLIVADIKFEGNCLRRGLKRLKDVAFLNGTFKRAFIKRIQLKRCLKNFHLLALNSKAERFRALKSSKNVLRRWKQFLREDEPVDALYLQRLSGLQVWACFRWISLTTEGQVYPAFHSNKSHFNIDMNSRRRWYLEGKIRLSENRSPVFLNALAKLDVYQLKNMFHVWKLWVRSIVTFTRKGWYNRVKSSFQFWHHTACRRRHLSRGCKHLTLLNLRRIFAMWSNIHMGVKVERLLIQPKRRRRFFHSLGRHFITRSLEKLRVSRSVVFFKLNIFSKVMRKLANIVNKRKMGENLYHSVRYLSNRNTKLLFFSLWTIRAAREINVRNKVRNIANKRFQSLLWYSFFGWFHMYERSRWIRQSEREKLLAHAIQMKNKMRLIEGNRKSKQKFYVLRKWARVTRSKRGGATISKFILTKVYKNFMSQAFRRWYLVTNLHIVMTCMQKYWRGYRCRNLAIIKKKIPGLNKFITRNEKRNSLSCGQFYQYIKWYRSKAFIFVAFNNKSLKLRMLLKWKDAIKFLKDEFEAIQYEIMMIRGMRQFRVNMNRKNRNVYANGVRNSDEKGIFRIFEPEPRYRMKRALRKVRENVKIQKANCVIVSHSRGNHLCCLLLHSMKKWNRAFRLKQVGFRLAIGFRMEHSGRSHLRRFRIHASGRISRRRQFIYMCTYSSIVCMIDVLGHLYQASVMRKILRSRLAMGVAHYTRYNLTLSFALLWLRKNIQRTRRALFVDSLSIASRISIEGGLVIMSLNIARLKMKRVFRLFRLCTRCKKLEAKLFSRRKQNIVDKMRVVNAFDRNAMDNKFLRRMIRRNAKSMDIYKMKNAFRRVFFIPYNSHGLRAVSNRLKSMAKFAVYRLKNFVSFFLKKRYQYAHLLGYYIKRTKDIYFKKWLLRFRRKCHRTQRNEGRLEVWRYALKNYYFKVLYRVLAISRRLKMVCYRFQLGGSMNHWAVTTAQRIRYKHIIRICTLRRVKKVIFECIDAWRLHTKLEMCYRSRTIFLRQKSQELAKKKVIMLWTKACLVSQETRTCHIVYETCCRKKKNAAFSAWLNVYKENRRIDFENVNVVFTALLSYCHDRQYKRHRRNVTGPNHYKSFRMSRGIAQFRLRSFYYYLSNRRGEKAASDLARISCRNACNTWRLRVWYCKKGSRELYAYFRACLPYALIEKIWNHLADQSKSRSLFSVASASDLIVAEDPVSPLNMSSPAHNGVSKSRQHDNTYDPLERLYMNTQTEIKNLRHNFQKDRRVKSDDVYRILALPSRKQSRKCREVVSQISRCRRLLKWWKLHTDYRVIQERSKMKRLYLTAWRKGAIRYRSHFTIFLRVFTKNAQLYRMQIYFVLLHRNRRTNTLGKMLQKAREMHLLRTSWKPWRRKYCVRRACFIASEVASKVKRQTGIRIVTLGFHLMKISRITRERVKDPILLRFAWERILKFYLAVKHSEKYMRRSVVEHLHLLCLGRRRRRSLVKAGNAMRRICDIWFRRVYLHLLKRSYCRWKEKFLNEELGNQAYGRTSATLGVNREKEKMNACDEFKDNWRAKFSDYKKIKSSILVNKSLEDMFKD